MRKRHEGVSLRSGILRCKERCPGNVYETNGETEGEEMDWVWTSWSIRSRVELLVKESFRELEGLFQLKEVLSENNVSPRGGTS